MSLSDALEVSLLNHVLLGGTAYTRPTSLLISLHTADPGDDGEGDEVSGGAYARQAITFAAAASGSAATDADVTFPVATAGWGTITHFVIRDQAGNPLVVGALTASRTVATDDQLKFPSGQLTVTLD